MLTALPCRSGAGRVGWARRPHLVPPDQGSPAPFGGAGDAVRERVSVGRCVGEWNLLRAPLRLKLLISQLGHTLNTRSHSQQMPTVESVLNQSIDAINVVGRVALAVGTAIDNAIEVSRFSALCA